MNLRVGLGKTSSLELKKKKHIQYASPLKEKRIGENALNILLINAVVPLFFAYGLHNKQISQKQMMYYYFKGLMFVRKIEDKYK